MILTPKYRSHEVVVFFNAEVNVQDMLTRLVFEYVRALPKYKDIRVFVDTAVENDSLIVDLMYDRYGFRACITLDGLHIANQYTVFTGILLKKFKNRPTEALDRQFNVDSMSPNSSKVPTPKEIPSKFINHSDPKAFDIFGCYMNDMICALDERKFKRRFWKHINIYVNMLARVIVRIHGK